DVAARAVETVAPAVVLADELPGNAPRLLVRSGIPNQFVPPVSTRVVEGANHAVDVARDDHRGLGGRDLLGEVAASLWKLLDPPNVEPGALEDRLALELVELG